MFLVIRIVYAGASAMAPNQKRLDPPPVFSWDKGLGCRPAKTLSQSSFGQKLIPVPEIFKQAGIHRNFLGDKKLGKATAA